MERDSMLCGSFLNLSLLLICCFLFKGHCDYSYGDPVPYNSFTISSFSYPETRLKPYDWRYIRVELPPWFSSMSISLESDVDFDFRSVMKVPKSTLPLICFRDGSLPLPNFSDHSLNHLALSYLSNGSIGAIQGLQNVEHCYPMEKKITVTLTNEQIAPGVWYVGLFNGIGAMRTQSKMISRGSSYSYTASVSVEGCTASNLGGQYCNQTVQSLSCAQSLTNNYSLSYNHTVEYSVSCQTSVEDSCQQDNETRVYSLEIMGLAEQLTISATAIRLNGTPSVSSGINASRVVLMCYARYGAMPLATAHDYSVDINKGPLIIPLPKVGRWYISIAPVNLTKISGGNIDYETKACYSLAWQVVECPLGRAGFNCSWQRYTLQTVLRKNPFVPFESYYTPLGGEGPSDSANFPLEPLLSNSSVAKTSGDVWTYFVLDIPRGAAGGNLHFRVTSDKKFGNEIYVRFGGLPSSNIWDYYYVNKANSSTDSIFFKLYNSSNEMVDFYVLYAREGTWSFAMRSLNSSDNASNDQIAMSVSLERCPKKCSPHGSCKDFVDESGLTVYSYCSCDRTHGGIDCSIQIISDRGHLWQSVSLIASNAAAILPAYWALRKRAFAEWVIFTSSGISSGLYHACDVGTWCALTYHVLQFMDFWLSFMAVVSTFVYLAAIDEALRRTIQAAVSILTALMAISGATRSANIILVIAIGAAGLLIGWLIEFSTKYRSLSSAGLCLNTLYSWQTVRTSLVNMVKTLMKRFHWGFLLAGFVALAMASVSWKLETSKSYWIWHSIWHVSIYTSSFLFLCSNSTTVDNQNQRPEDSNYELTRQDSIPRRGE